MVNNLAAVQTTQKYTLNIPLSTHGATAAIIRGLHLQRMKVEMMYFRTDYTILCLQNIQADAWALDPVSSPRILAETLSEP